MNFEGDRRDTIINSIIALFAHEIANSRITRTFVQCDDEDHKNDCMRKVLERAKHDRDLFIINLGSIIRLHSNALSSDEDLVFNLNRILHLISIKYDIEKGIITANHVPSVLLSRDEMYLKFDTKFIPDSFYNSLLEQINITYLDDCYSATTILLRKLFENLIIDILRKKYGTDTNKTLYWNSKRKQFLSFSTLIENFSKKINDFETYSKRMDKKFIDFLNKNIRFPGNESAHSIEDNISKDELEKKQQQINNYVEILFSIFSKL